MKMHQKPINFALNIYAEANESSKRARLFNNFNTPPTLPNCTYV